MQSNRLVVTLNKEMQIGFERGLNQVYENSNLVNEFAVKPSFLLETGQSMWITFKNAASNATVTLKSTLLAERKVTAIYSDGQDVDNDVAQMQQTVGTGYEYFTLLPKEVMRVPGTWYFSVQICQLPEGASYDDADVTEVLQNKTSDIADFTVYSSIAGEGPNGSAPSDLDVFALYNTATKSVEEAKEYADKAADLAADAAKSASDAANVAADVEEVVANATDIIAKQATEQATAATKQAVEDEASRAEQAEAELAQKFADTFGSFPDGITIGKADEDDVNHLIGIRFIGDISEDGIYLEADQADMHDEYHLKLPAKDGTVATLGDIDTKIAAAITTALNTPV